MEVGAERKNLAPKRLDIGNRNGYNCVVACAIYDETREEPQP